MISWEKVSDMTSLIEYLMVCHICGRKFWVPQPEPLPFTPTLPAHQREGGFPCAGSEMPSGPKDTRPSG